MAAYIVFNVDEVTNPELFARYREKAPSVLRAQGISLLAGPPVSEMLEGSPVLLSPLIRFDTVDEARTWYWSPEYQELAKMRREATTGRAYIVEGP